MGEPWQWLLQSAPGEDAVDSQHHLDPIDEAVAGLRGLTSVLEEVPLWVKHDQSALSAAGKSFVKDRAHQCSVPH